LPIGTIIGQPSQKFAMPRSYLWGISLKWAASHIYWVDNQVAVWDVTDTTFYFGLIFKPEFWAWSSNRWTVDFVLQDAWYVNPNPTFGTPLDCYVSYFGALVADGPVLEISPFGLGSVQFPHAMPPADAPYWANGDMD